MSPYFHRVCCGWQRVDSYDLQLLQIQNACNQLKIVEWAMRRATYRFRIHYEFDPKNYYRKRWECVRPVLRTQIPVNWPEGRDSWWHLHQLERNAYALRQLYSFFHNVRPTGLVCRFHRHDNRKRTGLTIDRMSWNQSRQSLAGSDLCARWAEWVRVR